MSNPKTYSPVFKIYPFCKRCTAVWKMARLEEREEERKEIHSLIRRTLDGKVI